VNAALVVLMLAHQTGGLRGAVTAAETGEPLGFSIVQLVPNLGRQFTDRAGVFAFRSIPAGTYLLSVRQIGYTPFDSQLVIRAGGDLRLHVVLRHLAVELPAITITAQAKCTHPGPPDRVATPALATVFDELLENARRLELLADSYPFRMRLERAFRMVDKRGDTLGADIDTLLLESDETQRPYRPGQVVTQGTGPFRDRRIVSLPSLREFGDSVFLRYHCFRLAGRDTIEGETLVRIDFEPADHLSHPDVAGSAYLDSLTYQLRYTDSELTRPGRARIRSIRGLTARIRFRDVVPGIVLQEYVEAITTFRSGEFTSRVETQRFVGVQFKRPPP
jgi:hypothetical protein